MRAPGDREVPPEFLDIGGNLGVHQSKVNNGGSPEKAGWSRVIRRKDHRVPEGMRLLKGARPLEEVLRGAIKVANKNEGHLTVHGEPEHLTAHLLPIPISAVAADEEDVRAPEVKGPGGDPCGSGDA